MSVLLKPFDGFDKIKIDEYSHKPLSLIEPPDDYAISRNIDGTALSLYRDSVWDLSPYQSNKSQKAKLIFHQIAQHDVRLVKRLMFISMVFGVGRGGSHLSVQTLRHRFISGFKPLSVFALKKKTNLQNVLEDSRLLREYISSSCNTTIQASSTSAIMNTLFEVDNSESGVDYMHDPALSNKVKEINANGLEGFNQTPIIPVSILASSLKHRWEQIDEIKNNLTHIASFLGHYLDSQWYAAADTFNTTIKKTQSDFIPWNDAVTANNLNDIFDKYNVTNRRKFQGFIGSVQGTCQQLIYAYTGMRSAEATSLKTECMEICPHTGSLLLSGETTKFAGQRKAVKWVTSKEIKKVINILTAINAVVAKQYKFDVKTLPLFVPGSLFTGTCDSPDFNKRSKFSGTDGLPLPEEMVTIKEEDVLDLEAVEYDRDWRSDEKFAVGQVWSFSSHQYRRSLAVYSIGSGLVSLGALQYQFKHLFRDMTLYYQNGATFAKKLFEVPKNHIAHEINKLKPEIDALAYIKNVIMSDSQLFGAHGVFAQNQIKPTISDENQWLLSNREKTIKQFKNGEIAWKETMLGGCVSVEPCDSRLTRSIVACLDCDCGVHTKERVVLAVEKHELFMNSLPADSVEYRSEMEDHDVLKKYCDSLERKSK